MSYCVIEEATTASHVFFSEVITDIPYRNTLFRTVSTHCVYVPLQVYDIQNFPHMTNLKLD